MENGNSKGPRDRLVQRSETSVSNEIITGRRLTLPVSTHCIWGTSRDLHFSKFPTDADALDLNTRLDSGDSSPSIDIKTEDQTGKPLTKTTHSRARPEKALPGTVGAAGPSKDPHLHSCVQELSHIVVAATGELVSCHPLEGILDVLVVDKDEFLSLAKTFCDKGCQPTQVKKKSQQKEGLAR